MVLMNASIRRYRTCWPSLFQQRRRCGGPILIPVYLDMSQQSIARLSVCLPIDFDFQKESPSDVQQTYTTLDEPDTSTHRRERENCLEMAKKNILEAQAKQKANYDKRHAKPD